MRASTRALFEYCATRWATGSTLRASVQLPPSMLHAACRGVAAAAAFARRRRSEANRLSWLLSLSLSLPRLVGTSARLVSALSESLSVPRRKRDGAHSGTYDREPL